MGPHLMLLRYFTIATSSINYLSNNKVIVMHGEFGAFFFSKRKESVG